MAAQRGQSPPPPPAPRPQSRLYRTVIAAPSHPPPSARPPLGSRPSLLPPHSLSSPPPYRFVLIFPPPLHNCRPLAFAETCPLALRRWAPLSRKHGWVPPNVPNPTSGTTPLSCKVFLPEDPSPLRSMVKNRGNSQNLNPGPHNPFKPAPRHRKPFGCQCLRFFSRSPHMVSRHSPIVQNAGVPGPSAAHTPERPPRCSNRRVAPHIFFYANRPEPFPPPGPTWPKVKATSTPFLSPTSPPPHLSATRMDCPPSRAPAWRLRTSTSVCSTAAGRRLTATGPPPRFSDRHAQHVSVGHKSETSV